MSAASMEYISAGIILGLVAGISPGPLLTLVISETLKGGRQAGIRMAMVPVITDLPIVLFSLVVLAGLTHYETVVGIIAVAGGFFLLYLAYENIFFKQDSVDTSAGRKRGFIKGIISNFLSPHPYLFWILVGGTMIMKAYKIHISVSILFVGLFYLCLVGSKILVVLLIQRFSNLLSTRFYLYTLRILGICLCGFSVYFFIKGVNYIF